MAKGSLSENGLNFIKRHEGYQEKSYRNKNEKYYTVGYGHYGPDVMANTTYSEAQCSAFLQNDITSKSKDVNKIYDSDKGMTQNMFDAMTSFAYNHGNISNTELGKLIKNNPNDNAIIKKWQSSYTVNGILSKRRTEEVNLYFGTTSGALVPYTGDNNVYSNSISTVSSGETLSTSTVINNFVSDVIDSSNTAKFPPRIYEEFGTEIIVDELSMPLQSGHGGISSTDKPIVKTGDSSTNSIVNSSSNTKADYSGLSANDNADNKTPTSGGANQVLSKGITYPLIRIKDHYFNVDEIDYMQIDVKDFIPTIELHVSTIFKDLMKDNLITAGEKCSVYINSDGDNVVKSLRCDFVITNAYNDGVSQEFGKQYYSFIIYGELYIPDMYNSGMNFSFAGSSRDALRQTAKMLKLGFYFNDPEDTDDAQVWQNTPIDNQGIKDFIKDVASHAWKSPQYFYDCWIDPRYAIVFENVNEMLGVDGPDEGFDIAKYVSNITHNLETKGKMENGYNKGYTMKILHNLNIDTNSFTPFNVLKYEVVNQASAITNEIGIKNSEILELNNTGVDDENASFELSYQLVLNQWKLDNGFYALIAPGKTGETYQVADNGNYAEQQNNITPEKQIDVNSTEDGEVIKNTGSNELASGNVNVNYQSAYMHNLINNMQLKKMYIDVLTSGLNLQIMRGEKIPMLIFDKTVMEKIYNRGAANSIDNAAEALSKEYDITASGWFYVGGISYIYDPGAIHYTSKINKWYTKLILERREWPIPIPFKKPEIKNNVAEGSNVSSTVDSSNNSSNKTSSNKSSNSSSSNKTVSLDGLKDYMKQLYNAMQRATNNGIKLVSARRWAVDEKGNKVEGNAFVVKNRRYKCINSVGKIIYFAQNNSRHLYGEAFDFINNTGNSFTDILRKIIASKECLDIIYNHGLSIYRERAIDDYGAVYEHYHVGTERGKQQEFWNIVFFQLYGSAFSTGQYGNYLSKNSTLTEIKHNIVQEK